MSLYVSKRSVLFNVLILFFLAYLVGVAVYKNYFYTPELPIQNTALSARSCDFHYAKNVNVRCYFYKTQSHAEFVLPMALISQKRIGEGQPRQLMVQIPGGPGQGRMTVHEEIKYWVDWMQENDAEFDLLLYDPRGTGEGSPALVCEPYRQQALTLLSKSVPLIQEYQTLNTALETCFGQLKKYHDPSQLLSIFEELSTQEQAKDIVGMAEALGYSDVHLWGVSYGTRVALVAAQYDIIKTLILDSPYPFEKGLFSEWPDLYKTAFDFHSELFSAFQLANDVNYEELYRQAETKLDNNPITVEAEDWQTEKKISFTLNKYRLFEMSYSVLYKPYLYRGFHEGLLTFVMEDTISDDFQDVIDDFASSVFDAGFSYMVYFITECVDNRPESEDRIQAAINAFPEFREYFALGYQYDVCSLFDSGSPRYVQWLDYTNKPTLVFSGQFDPVTPTEWGDLLMEKIPGARHIAVDHAAHGVLFSSDCNWEFVSQFIQSKDVSLNISCIAEELWQ